MKNNAGFIFIPSLISVSIEESGAQKEIHSNKKTVNSSFFELWNIKSVPEITFALFFLKFVRYGKIIMS